MSNMHEAPIGELLDLAISSSEGPTWFPATIIFVGKRTVIYEDRTGFEWSGPFDLLEWRYPIDERKRLEEKILSEWRTKSIDYAHDHFDHIPKLWLLQWMMDNGVSVE